MPEFHRQTPSRVYKGEYLEVHFESDYPIECFGAPKQYAAYLTTEHETNTLGASETEAGLLTELYRWKANNLVYRLIKTDIVKYGKEVRQRTRSKVVTTSRQPATKKAAAPKAKAKKTAAKPAKNGKAKKTAAPELTAAQRKRLAATGSVTVKRGSKFVTVRR